MFYSWGLIVHNRFCFFNAEKLQITIESSFETNLPPIAPASEICGVLLPLITNDVIYCLNTNSYSYCWVAPFLNNSISHKYDFSILWCHPRWMAFSPFSNSGSIIGTQLCAESQLGGGSGENKENSQPLWAYLPFTSVPIKPQITSTHKPTAGWEHKHKPTQPLTSGKQSLTMK